MSLMHPTHWHPTHPSHPRAALSAVVAFLFAVVLTVLLVIEWQRLVDSPGHSVRVPGVSVVVPQPHPQDAPSVR